MCAQCDGNEDEESQRAVDDKISSHYDMVSARSMTRNKDLVTLSPHALTHRAQAEVFAPVVGEIVVSVLGLV